MDRKLFSPVLLTLGSIILIVIALIGAQSLSTLRTAPASQFSLARHRWETNAISHYRMAGNYTGNFSQCYYDIEVQKDRIVDIFTMSCLSSAESKTLTVGGIFKNFERFAAGQVCSPNGCYCEGIYVVSATYDPTLGYPQSITTSFHRRWLDDLLHGKIGVQQCLRIDPVVEKFEIVKLTILP
jgi:hypothetical protein